MPLSPTAEIDRKIAQPNDWRGQTLAAIRAIIHDALPNVIEEWKWMGTPVWSLNGIICTGESYKSTVKMTFLHGASLPDPHHLFNASLSGNARRAIDFHQNDPIPSDHLADLLRAAAAFNAQRPAKTPRPKS